MGIEGFDARRALPAWGVWLAAASLYFLFAWTTLKFGTSGNGIATVWPANAVLVALLLAGKRRRWGLVLSAGFVANVAATLAAHGASVAPLLFGTANLIEISVAVAMLHNHVGRSDILSSPAMLGRFVLAAAIVAPGLSGVVGAGTTWLLYEQDYLQAYKTWMLGDGLGLLIFTPVLLALLNGDFVRTYREQSWRQRGEAAAWMMLTAAAAWIVFFVALRPALFVLFAPVMLATFRVGRLGTTLAVMLVAVVGAVATVHGLGPVALVTADRVEQAQLFQVFVAVLLFTCLPVAAELSKRGRFTRELVQREQLMSYRASTDALTGLFNRAAFQARAVEVMAETPLERHCLVAIDLDRFKDVNDRWGHHAGDMALTHLAAVMRAQLRTRDIVGRLGGDEFLLLLPDTDANEAQAICDRIRAALRRMSLTVDEKTEIMLSISCGVASSRSGRTYGELARQADRALYLAKASGRNTVRSVA